MLRKLLIILILSSPAFSQLSSTGNITASGTTCATTNACIVLTLFNSPTLSTTAATITVSGTYSGTLQFEISADGINFSAISGINGASTASSTTSTGTWTFGIPAQNVLRVRASAFSSGTATILIQASAGQTPTAAQVLALFGGPGTSSQYLAANGTIQTAAGGAGTVTTTGSPASPNLAAFSGATSITNATAHNVSSPLNCPAASASGTAYTCTTTPTFVPADGDVILFQADVANTGAATLVVNSQSGTPAIKKQGGGTALVANDLLVGQDTLLEFDGTNWQMQGQTGNAASGTGFTVSGSTALFGTSPTGGTFNLYLGTGTTQGVTTATGTNNICVNASNLECYYSLTSGSTNIAIGQSSLFSLTQGSFNVAIGNDLGGVTTGTKNTAVGNSAQSGGLNVSQVTAVGWGALQNNQTVEASAFGNQSQQANTTGLNSSFGSLALLNNTDGTNNDVFGEDTIRDNVHGSRNIAMGARAGQSINGGNDNTALGFTAGYTATTANANVTGNFNTWVGSGTGPGSATQFSNQTVIGALALGTCSNCVVLGRTTAIVAGGDTTFAARFSVDSSTTLVAGDFVLSAEWGTTASIVITDTTSKDSAAVVTVTSAGTGQAANPTIAFTFHDGTWTNTPACIAIQTGGTGIFGDSTTTARSATAQTWQWNATPTAAANYQFTIHCTGT